MRDVEGSGGGEGQEARGRQSVKRNGEMRNYTNGY